MFGPFGCPRFTSLLVVFALLAPTGAAEEFCYKSGGGFCHLVENGEWHADADYNVDKPWELTTSRAFADFTDAANFCNSEPNCLGVHKHYTFDRYYDATKISQEDLDNGDTSLGCNWDSNSCADGTPTNTCYLKYVCGEARGYNPYATSAPTESPTPVPTESPTPVPTESPTPVPTESPTESPTPVPTESPTESPTPVPTESPTPVPTESPTPVPTESPTPVPTESPTPVPTESPTPVPTASPTPAPTATPSEAPTAVPSTSPTESPTAVPTESPTPVPTASPTDSPTKAPTRHHCDSGELQCDTARGFCVKHELPYVHECRCDEGFECTHGCSYPHFGHECQETKIPTATPTAAPMQHVCNSGEHLCDALNGKCTRHPLDNFEAYECSCDDGFECVQGCGGYPYENHECRSSAAPTSIPTKSPTPHYCDSQKHVCDKANGACAKHASGYYDMYDCQCREGLACVSGCDYPYANHECQATAQPSQAPTALPTVTYSTSSDSGAGEAESSAAPMVAGVAVAAFIAGGTLAILLWKKVQGQSQSKGKKENVASVMPQN